MKDKKGEPITCPSCGSKHITMSTYSIMLTDSEGNSLDPGGSYHCTKCGHMWERPGPMGAVLGTGSR